MKTSDLSDTGSFDAGPFAGGSGRRLIVVVAALVAVVVLAGIGIYGLIAGPEHQPGGSGEVGVRPGPVPVEPGDRTPVERQLPVVVASADPATFAANVAETLFAWDTASGFMPLDYTSVILAVGDPTGEEQAGLAADVAAYLPNRAAWIELRKYTTRQHLSIEELFVPQAWAVAVEQAYPGQLLPGTVAYTITGTRHRAGVWNGQDVSSEHAVAFTVFLACGPTYETCHLLRLSGLDNPLR